MDWSKSQLQIAFRQLRHYLPYEEEVEYAVVARNHPNSLYIRPCLLATDRRLIYLEPAFLGLSSKPHSYNYSDFADIQLKKGLFTHRISLIPYPRKRLAAVVVDHLEKRRAEAFYHHVKMRIGRNEQDLSTASSASESVASQRAHQEDDLIVRKLSQLKKLHEEGLLSVEEFSRMKQDILSKM